MARTKGTQRTYAPAEAEIEAETSIEIKRAEMKVSQPVVPRPIMKPLRCLIGGAGNIIKDAGPVTGQEYSFHAGQITLVDSRDYEGLLARHTSPKKCCGGKSPSRTQPLYGAVT
jgi:hypothetical protein